jgi:hypothetical protein
MSESECDTLTTQCLTQNKHVAWVLLQLEAIKWREQRSSQRICLEITCSLCDSSCDSSDACLLQILNKTVLGLRYRPNSTFDALVSLYCLLLQFKRSNAVLIPVGSENICSRPPTSTALSHKTTLGYILSATALCGSRYQSMFGKPITLRFISAHTASEGAAWTMLPFQLVRVLYGVI